jgi:hypothetical protein
LFEAIVGCEVNGDGDVDVPLMTVANRAGLTLGLARKAVFDLRRAGLLKAFVPGEEDGNQEAIYRERCLFRVLSGDRGGDAIVEGVGSAPLSNRALVSK